MTLFRSSGKPHRFDSSGAYTERLEGERRRRSIPPEPVVERMQLTNDGVVLDLGAGIGYFSFPIAERAKEVIAVDIEPKMLSVLSQRIASSANSKIATIRGDISSLPLEDGAVDHVLAAFVYHEVPDQSEFLEEAARVLSLKGKLTVVDFQKRFTGEGPPIWVKKSPEHVGRTASKWFTEVSRFETKVFYQLSFVKRDRV